MTFGITQADIFLNLTRNRDTWKQDADMNGDGYVTQYEFSNYIVGEFNGAVDMGSDVISRFWNKFDTNKTGKLGNTDLNNRYALDETELERLGKQLEYYQVLDDYINDIDPPTVLSSTQYKWLSAIKNELSMVVENYTGNSNNLQATLDASFNNIKNYYTAVFCAEECLKDHDIFSQVPGYDYEQDRTLMNIIECFCNNLPNSSNEIAIKSGIQNIIKEYIDKAGFETNISLHTDLAQYDPSYNPNKWNDLQKAVIRNKLLEEYSSNENYSKYSTLYNSLIEEYINTLGSGSAFDDVIDHLTDKFKASDHGKKLTLIDEFLTDYSNLDSSSSLYDTLSDALGNDATDIITTNDIDTTFYKNIINEILNKIISGEIENLDDMENTIYNQIITNLDAFKKDLIKKVDAGKVVDLTDTLWENIKPEDNENLDEVRKTAKQICTYLVTKGGKIGIAVYDIFGQNFRTAINDLDRSELNSKIEELFEKIGKIDSDQNNKYTGHSTGICTDNNGDGITEHHCDFGWWSNGDSDANGWGGKPAHVANKGTLDLTPWCIHKSETYKTGDLKDYEVDYEYSILEGSGSIIGSTF
ncbi:hypothetical protein IKB17_05100, partial [bacterium]|nr:hypothetical protein [bacterium]